MGTPPTIGTMGNWEGTWDTKDQTDRKGYWDHMTPLERTIGTRRDKTGNGYWDQMTPWEKTLGQWGPWGYGDRMTCGKGHRDKKDHVGKGQGKWTMMDRWERTLGHPDHLGKGQQGKWTMMERTLGTPRTIWGKDNGDRVGNGP